MDLPYFTDYPKDYLADTAHLTWAEKGVYQTLRCLLWDKGSECRLRADDETLSRLLGMPLREWRKFRAVLVEGDFPLFYVDEEGRLYERSLLQRYAKAVEKSVKNRKAAEARWDQRRDANAHADAYTNAHADAYTNGDARRYAQGNALGYAHSMRSQSESPYPDPELHPEAQGEGGNTRARASSGYSSMPRRYVVAQEHLEFAKSVGWKGALSELQLVADDFRDYFRNKVSDDWDAEFRRWVRREAKMYEKKKGGQGAPPPAPPRAEPSVHVVGHKPSSSGGAQ